MTQWKTWAQTTALGFTALSNWQLETAAEYWIEAGIAVRNDEEIGNPCFASAQNNAAIGYALVASRQQANQAFDEAAAAWNAVARRIAQEDVHLASGSSGHHLRLASRHSAPFAKLLRLEYQRLAGAAAAISQWNARVFGHREDVAPGDMTIVIEAFGPESFEARLIEDACAAALTPDIAAGWPAGWKDQARRASASVAALGKDLSFWKRLDTAVDMTALMPLALGAGSAKRLAGRIHD